MLDSYNYYNICNLSRRFHLPCVLSHNPSENKISFYRDKRKNIVKDMEKCKNGNSFNAPCGNVPTWADL